MEVVYYMTQMVLIESNFLIYVTRDLLSTIIKVAYQMVLSSLELMKLIELYHVELL